MTKDLNDMTLREIRASYYNTVNAIASEIWEDLTSTDSDPDYDDIQDQVFEAASGSAWITYPFRSQLVLLISEHGADAHGDEPSTQAFFAMQADLSDQINRLREGI